MAWRLLRSAGCRRPFLHRFLGSWQLNSDALPPAHRVILLGASNLTVSFSTVVETVRLLKGQPVEFMAAMGHGRSFGQDSTVLGRKIPGIFPCSLWQDLNRRPPLPTSALLTDIGNDLLYGVPVERLLEWVAGCLDHLAAARATTIMTRIPIGNLQRLNEPRFRFFRTLLFPKSRLKLPQVKSLAGALDEQLTTLALRRKIPIIPVSNAWYGFDPIHLKASARRLAWPAILSSWETTVAAHVVPSRSLWRRAYLNCLAPAEHTLFGIRCRCRQPSGLLADGSTVSLY